jgi:hypothetical protein
VKNEGKFPFPLGVGYFHQKSDNFSPVLEILTRPELPRPLGGGFSPLRVCAFTSGFDLCF